MWAHFLREVEGRTTVEFDFTNGGRVATIVAEADPMARGPEFLVEFLADRAQFRKLLTPESGFAIFSLFLRGDDWGRLYRAWLDAAGLDEVKLDHLRFALDHLEDAEADFMRFCHGLDIRDWFAGTLPSRRVAVLVGDLRQRPETLLGARDLRIVRPLTSGEIMLAQSVAANSEAQTPHFLLITQAQRDADIELREKQARMQARGLSA